MFEKMTKKIIRTASKEVKSSVDNTVKDYLPIVKTGVVILLIFGGISMKRDPSIVIESLTINVFR